jgi:hypothetical protein
VPYKLREGWGAGVRISASAFGDFFIGTFCPNDPPSSTFTLNILPRSRTVSPHPLRSGIEDHRCFSKMDAIISVLDRVHTGEQDPFESYEGHEKLVLVDVFEITSGSKSPHPPATDTFEFRKATIEADDELSLNSWLSMSDCSSTKKSRLRLLLVSAFLDVPNIQREARTLDRKLLKRAFDTFGLPYSGLTSLRRVSSEFLTFPKTHTSFGEGEELSKFCYSQGWWTMSWTWHENKGVTKAIALMDRDHVHPINDKLVFRLKKLKNLAAQRCYLGLTVGAVALSQLSTFIFNNAKNDDKVSNVLFDVDLGGNPVDTDYSRISRDINFRAYFTSIHRIRLHTLRLLLETLAQQNTSPRRTIRTVNDERDTETIAQSILHLHQKVSSTILLAEHLRDRANMQLASLFNIIAQNNQVTSIDIATSSRQVALESKLDQKISIEIADASRAIAAESKRDSTAMKTIAAVTMVFLPGTFVASLFSTPLFHWDKNSGFGVASQIWIYWAITIPVTFLTIAVWWLWLRVQHAPYHQPPGRYIEIYDDLRSQVRSPEGEKILERPCARHSPHSRASS